MVYWASIDRFNVKQCTAAAVATASLHQPITDAVHAAPRSVFCQCTHGTRSRQSSLDFHSCCTARRRPLFLDGSTSASAASCPLHSLELRCCPEMDFVHPFIKTRLDTSDHRSLGVYTTTPSRCHCSCLQCCYVMSFQSTDRTTYTKMRNSFYTKMPASHPMIRRGS